MHSLILYNNLSCKKEVFEPINKSLVKMYVCGVTPYDYSHLGHGRVYVTFDLLYRLLLFLDYKVAYCRNFTDIDDKILNRALKDFGDKNRYKEISDLYIKNFEKDMKDLNCFTPTYEPRVTENIDKIINFVDQLVKNGSAYNVDNDVYFSIKSFPEYGKLSKRNLDEMLAGARVAINEKKRDDLDFALWKGAGDGPGWDSPWGKGRPGWHIECSALAKNYLGEQIDIHGGGMDLIFPHHENEIAQTEALTKKPFAKFWIHNAFLQINKEKMSKSLGNFLFLNEIFKRYEPIVLRYFFLQHHYRNPIDFELSELDIVRKNYQKLAKLFNDINLEDVEFISLKEDIFSNPVTKEMMDFLCDDLNTPGLFGVIFKNLQEIQENKKLKTLVKYILVNLLGLPLEILSEKEIELTDEIKNLMKLREEAREKKDWKASDEIREKLKKLGIEVQDKKLK